MQTKNIKIMLKLKDLKKHIVYEGICGDSKILFMPYKAELYDNCSKYTRSNSPNVIDDIFEANEKDSHWLNCCIQANKFISYEEAIKTFNQPFCIELNSQEELDAIMSFYKEKGYKEFGNSHTYQKGYVVDIKPKDKEWQTATDNWLNRPVKTLSELGIEIKPQFEVGKWYKNTNKISYRKCSETGYKLKYNEAIFCDIDKGWERSNGFASWKCVSLLTDLSEIQEYLPDGHPDKIKSMKETNCEFKVGDWVKCINSKAQSYDVSIENKPFKVLEIKNGRLGKYVTGFQKKYPELMRAEGGIYFTNLRKCTLQEIESIVHTLTDEEILDVCKQYYTIGTKFNQKTAYNGNGEIQTVTIGCFLLRDSNISVDGYGIFNRKYSKFAEIISSPKEETFVLPERWAIKTCKEAGDWLDENSDIPKQDRLKCGYAKTAYKYLHYPSHNNSHIFETICDGYTEITFKQFKKYVLKEENNFENIKQPLLTSKECYSSEIEVGDEVEMISHNPIDGFGEVEVGDKGIVTSIGTNRYIIDFPNHSEWAGLASELKLIKKASKSIFVSKPVKSSNKPELIPIKVRNVSTFVTPKRIKTTITKPKLIY